MTSRTLYQSNGTPFVLTDCQYDSFWRRVVQAKRGCQEWTGFVADTGYGLWTVAIIGTGRTVSFRPHRVAYELAVGPIPPGLTIDHLCRNKLCCNAKHLEPVSALENYRRSLPFRPPRRRNYGASVHERTRADGSTAYRVHCRVDGKQKVLTFGTRAEADHFAAIARSLGTPVALAEQTYLDSVS